MRYNHVNVDDTMFICAYWHKFRYITSLYLGDAMALDENEIASFSTWGICIDCTKPDSS